jgi:hypothetical protein
LNQIFNVLMILAGGRFPVQAFRPRLHPNIKKHLYFGTQYISNQ